MTDNRVADGTAYRTEGEGEPIVFVHGVGMNKDVWAPQLEAFATTHRVVAYDMLGHGGSRLPPAEPTLSDYADQLRRLLDALSIDRAIIVGHSMGALVALAFAMAHPGRVLRLVALNAVYDRTPEQRAAIEARAARLAQEGIGATLDGTLARWFGEPGDGSLTARARQVRSWLEAADPVGYARTYGLFATADDAFVGKLDRLAVPALFLTGEHDLNSSPEMSRRMAEIASKGMARVIPGERHMMSFTSPETVNPILRNFLSIPVGPDTPAQAGLRERGPGSGARKQGGVAVADPAIDVRELRRALGAFVTGVTVVTTIDAAGAPRGFTANSFSSVSLDPPLVLVCVAKTASSCPVFSAAKGYAVNILAEGQREVSGTFASRSADKFGAVSWRKGRTGSPILDGVAAWLDCELHDTVDAGDHVILIGRVLAFDHAPANPLGYCRGNYVDFGLARDALEVAGGQRTRVGAILERAGLLLLLTDGKTGAVSLPVAAHLGERGDARSLAGTVAGLGVEAEIGFLFAVFEDARSTTHSIYYRGEVYGGEPDPFRARFYAFDDIPWDRLPDDAVRSMLRRYVSERREDTFGVYVGGVENGVVQALGKRADRAATPARIV